MRHSIPRSAFTLVELLVVAAIIVVVMALAIPAFNAIGGGQSLTSGADIVAGNLELARQTAMAENMRTELRFWNVEEEIGGDGKWGAVQLFRVDSGAALGKVQRLPNGVVILENATFSTLLGSDNPHGDTADMQNEKARPYKSVRFRPDGSSELHPGGSWTITVVPATSTPTANRPADNFATVQVDPVTGRAVTYRP